MCWLKLQVTSLTLAVHDLNAMYTSLLDTSTVDTNHDAATQQCYAMAHGCAIV